MENKCTRCGRCCFYPYVGKMKRCKYLENTEDGLTKCSIYETRLGTVIDVTPEGYQVICLTREQTRFWIIGCPYNKAIWLRNKNYKHEVKL